MLNIPKFSLYNYYYAKHCSWHKPGNRRTKGEIKEDIVFAHWLSTEVQTLGSLWCARVMCRISNLYGGRLVSKLHHHTLPHSGMVPSFRYAIFIQVCYISSFRHAIYLHSGIIISYFHSGMLPSFRYGPLTHWGIIFSCRCMVLWMKVYTSWFWIKYKHNKWWMVCEEATIQQLLTEAKTTMIAESK